MKKRLRKKYRVGEFQELCFRLSFKFKEGVQSEAVEQFLDDFMVQCMEAHELCFDGVLSLANPCSFVIHALDAKTTAEPHREAVKAWMDARTDVEAVSVSGIVDAWYGEIED